MTIARGTYRFRLLMTSVQGEIAARLLTQGQLPEQDCPRRLARICFSTLAGDAGHYWLGSDETTGLRDAITKIVAQQRHRAPRWAVEAEAVLHLCERTLGLNPNAHLWPSLGNVHRLQRDRRAGCGTYSTPSSVLSPLCRHVLRYLPRSELGAPALLDLSIEGGSFPLEVLRQLRGRRVRFFGLDRDVAATSLAREVFDWAIRRSGRVGLSLRTSHRDSLFAPLPSGWPSAFEGVIGNPPWKRCSPRERRRFALRFPTLGSGHCDVYQAFILRAHELLRPGGVLGYILPSEFLFNSGAESVRRLLLDHYEIHELLLFPRGAFIEVPCIAPVGIVARKLSGRRASRSHITVLRVQTDVGRAERSPESRRIPTAGLWTGDRRAAFNPVLDSRNAWIRRLEGDQTLADLGELHSGALPVRDRGSPVQIPFAGLLGRHVRPFHTCARSAVQFSAGSTALHRALRTEWVSRTKVILKSVRCVTLARRLCAGRAGRGVVPVNTAAMFIPRSTLICSLVEALLNSDVANAWYKAHDLSRKIRLTVLERLPIVWDLRSWKTIAELGTSLRELSTMECAACQRFSGAQALSPSRSHGKRLIVTLKELNHEVERLYRLSQHQARVVARLSAVRVF